MDNETTGPVDYVVVEFPDGAPKPEGFARLLNLVDAGNIRVLDLEFISKAADGSVDSVDAATLDADAVGAFVGASSGLLDPDDFALLGDEISEGSLAAVLIYEELSLVPVLDAWRSEGANVLTAGQLTEDDIVEALDHTPGDAE